RQAAPRYARAPAASRRTHRPAGRGAGRLPRRTSCGRRRLVREEGEESAKRVLELAPLDDEVELAVLEEELGALEALRQRLTDRLREDARAPDTHDGRRHRARNT